MTQRYGADVGSKRDFLLATATGAFVLGFPLLGSGIALWLLNPVSGSADVVSMVSSLGLIACVGSVALAWARAPRWLARTVSKQARPSWWSAHLVLRSLVMLLGFGFLWLTVYALSGDTDFWPFLVLPGCQYLGYGARIIVIRGGLPHQPRTT